MRLLQRILLSAIIIGSFSYSYYVLTKEPCDKPIRYSVDKFSESFGISRADFLKAVSEAEAIWEKDAGRELFTLSNEGNLSINLIYDDRQATVDKNEVLESKADQASAEALAVEREFESKKALYEAAKRSFVSSLRSLENDLRAYNSRVNSWNAKGGAPSGEYAKLQAEADRLRAVEEALEGERLAMNALVQEVNALAAKYNSLIRSANYNIELINESADKEFEQGEHITDRNRWEINIYEFEDRRELVRVLAHEFGHALGIEHNQNPESIMYYLNIGESMALSVEDAASLIDACELKS